MEIRLATPNDVAALDEIDATVESDAYLHVDFAAEGGANLNLRLTSRPLTPRRVTPWPAVDDLRFAFRSVAGGMEEGLALIAEHHARPAATLLARPRPDAGTLDLLDLRVDYDFRRQGIGSAMLYRLVGHARDGGARAVYAEVPTDNQPAGELLLKCGFDPAGLDTRRRSNHDLVKEQATVFWYLSLD